MEYRGKTAHFQSVYDIAKTTYLKSSPYLGYNSLAPPIHTPTTLTEINETLIGLQEALVPSEHAVTHLEL